mgnify:CR=1 FL=1
MVNFRRRTYGIPIMPLLLVAILVSALVTVYTWNAGSMGSSRSTGSMGSSGSVGSLESSGMGKEPRGIHLTWAENDVYHTIAISWWTEEKTQKSLVLYDTVPHKDAIEKYPFIAEGEYAFRAEGTQHQISTSRSTWNCWYHDVILTGLEPGRTYYFVCGSPEGWSKEYSFRTIGLEQHVRFVFGGDSRIGAPVSSEIEGPVFPDARIAVSDAAAAEDPDFVLFCGDMVMHGYNERLWHLWLDDVAGHLVTDEGRIIPIVPAIGNHDLAYLAYYENGSWMDMTDYDYYRGIFALPGNELWYTLDFPNIRLIVLCAAGGTGFSEPGRSFAERVEDEAKAQVGFLREQLRTATQKWVITAQHVSITGGYGLKPGDSGWGMIYHWVPVFEESLTNPDLAPMVLNLASHSHHYVRTWPIAHLELPPDFVDFDYSLPPWDPKALWPNGPPIVELTRDSMKGVTYITNGVWGAPTEWMEKDSWIRIYPWFAAAYSRPGYCLIEDTPDGQLHVQFKHAGVVWSWYGLPQVYDEFMLPYTAPKHFPTAEYNVAF